MTLRDYVDVMKRWWKVIAALTLVGALAGGLLSLVLPAKYVATAQLYVSIPTSDSATELNQAATYLSRELKSYATVATSPYVLEPVAKDTGVGKSVADLQSMLDVTNPTATSIIQVDASAETPDEAEKVANGVAKELTEGVGSLSPEVANRAGAVKATVLSKAQRPDKASGIPSWTYPLIGLAVGALIGVVLAFIMGSLVRRPRTAEELRRIPGASLVASVPRVKTLSDARSFEPAALERSASGESTPQITALRSRLQQRHAEVLPQVDGCAVLTVTGDRSGDGATTVALELARSFVGLGSRVALVDAHLADRGMTELLAQQTHLGICDLVEHRAPANQSTVQLEQGLTFLPAGSPTSRSSDLVCSEPMVALIQELRAEFDVVILDCSPLGESADAVVLGELSDEILLVTVPGGVSSDRLQTAVEGFRGAPVSIVANKVRSSRGRSGLV
ncbi:polysaccharide biosynthesis tyrosine autokinase [Kocuria tytonis]|nr:polysaccharide biosynthesis tyrosine autokinase [Kocuria tytonis]